MTLKGNDIGTKIGAALTSAKNDPVIDITNGGTSVIHLLSIIAQINNSQNPLDPDIFFVPDGDEVAVTPTLLPFNSDILPGDTAEFEFPLNGSRNWSFLYSFTFDGDVYTTSWHPPCRSRIRWVCFLPAPLHSWSWDARQRALSRDGCAPSWTERLDHPGPVGDLGGLGQLWIPDLPPDHNRVLALAHDGHDPGEVLPGKKRRLADNGRR